MIKRICKSLLGIQEDKNVVVLDPSSLAGAKVSLAM